MSNSVVTSLGDHTVDSVKLVCPEFEFQSVCFLDMKSTKVLTHPK